MKRGFKLRAVTAKEVPEELENQLVGIIDNSDIKIVFQPIVSLKDGSVLGFEALSRGPENTPFQNPEELFEVADECGKLWELEKLCRTKALESAYESGSEIKLFLNVNPNIIHDQKFRHGFTKEYLKLFKINPENIFFEITEKSAISDLCGFKKTIEHYKKQNYKIAIDDAGSGYSGLNMITDIHPHYIKLDMKLIRGIDKDEYKKTLVRSLHEFCRLADVKLIAEGIETEEELKVLIDIGVAYGQGYLLQRPNEKIKPIDNGVLDCIKRLNLKRSRSIDRFLSNISIGDLCRTNITVPAQETSENVYNLFLSNSLLSGISVVNENKVAGIITKTQIDHMMSGQFGFSLHAKCPVALIMDKNPLVTDSETPIDTVAKLAMSRPAGSLYDFIIVTKNGDYNGIVTIKDLLEKTMEVKVTNARHLNPLSGLPGNIPIEKKLDKCISSDEPYTVLYIDVDNFKAYNDVYGFEKGDGVIRFIAGTLSDAVPYDEFIGHVGGDDFIVVLSSYEADSVCCELIKLFDAGIRNFYSEIDLKRGCVHAKNRKGEDDEFPIMALSVAGVTNKYDGFENIYQLSGCASVIKKKCKLEWNSCYIIR